MLGAVFINARNGRSRDAVTAVIRDGPANQLRTCIDTGVVDKDIVGPAMADSASDTSGCRGGDGDTDA